MSQNMHMPNNGSRNVIDFGLPNQQAYRETMDFDKAASNFYSSMPMSEGGGTIFDHHIKKSGTILT
jgi:hypothetical protein